VSSEPEKVLVIRLSSLGDLVLMAPLLKTLRSEMPGSEIHVLCKDKYVELFQENQNVDRLLPLMERMQKAGYTTAIIGKSPRGSRANDSSEKNRARRSRNDRARSVSRCGWVTSVERMPINPPSPPRCPKLS